MTMIREPGRKFNAPPAAGPVLIVLLAAGCWLCGNRPAAGQPPSGTTDYAYFEKLKKQADEAQKKADELYQKARAAAQPQIEAQAKARGGTDQARRQLG